MSYTTTDLADVFKKLQEHDIDVVVIGDTSIQLALRYTTFRGDLDLFVINHSPLVERELFEDIARSCGWEISATEIGTPSYIVPTSMGNLVVELYENYLDIYIPFEILEDTVEYTVDGMRIRAIKPEYYLVLKARQGVDLDKLKSYVKELKNRKLNTKLIEYAASLYPEDEKELILKRLAECDLEVS